MSDLEFINGFTKITLSKICKELNINQGNLQAGKNKKYEKIVRKKIESELSSLYFLSAASEYHMIQDILYYGDNNE